MTAQKKIKLIIFTAILIVIALCLTIVIQIVNVSISRKEIAKQQEQIQQLNNQLDSYNKTPNSDYEVIG